MKQRCRYCWPQYCLPEVLRQAVPRRVYIEAKVDAVSAAYSLLSFSLRRFLPICQFYILQPVLTQLTTTSQLIKEGHTCRRFQQQLKPPLRRQGSRGSRQGSRRLQTLLVTQSPGSTPARRQLKPQQHSRLQGQPLRRQQERRSQQRQSPGAGAGAQTLWRRTPAAGPHCPTGTPTPQLRP